MAGAKSTGHPQILRPTAWSGCAESGLSRTVLGGGNIGPSASVWRKTPPTREGGDAWPGFVPSGPSNTVGALGPPPGAPLPTHDHAPTEKARAMPHSRVRHRPTAHGVVVVSGLPSYVACACASAVSIAIE